MAGQPYQKLLDRFLARVDQVFPAGCTVILYGSAARGDWLPQRSDLNLLLVADAIRTEDLPRFASELQDFEKERMAPPYLMTRAEWDRAADVFPIELTDMRQAYRVLRGADLIAPTAVAPADLRLALESELRGKLLRLRADYALYAAVPGLLGAVVAASSGSLRVLLRATLVLAGKVPPADDAGLAAAVGVLLEEDADRLLTAFRRRRAPAWDCPAALFEWYLGVVQRATRYVDTFTPGVA